MEVVGHHLKGDHVDLGVESGDAVPLVLNGLADFGEDDVGSVAAPCLGEGIASQMAKEGEAAFGLERDHVEAPFGVVVTTGSAFHRRLLFTCIFLLLGKLFFGHKCVAFVCIGCKYSRFPRLCQINPVLFLISIWRMSK